MPPEKFEAALKALHEMKLLRFLLNFATSDPLLVLPFKFRVTSEPREQVSRFGRVAVDDFSPHRADDVIANRIAREVTHTPLPTHLKRKERTPAEVRRVRGRHGRKVELELFVEVDELPCPLVVRVFQRHV